MDERFEASKSPVFGIILLITCIAAFTLTLGIPLLNSDRLNRIHLLLNICISLPITVLFAWIWISTYYMIKDDCLLIFHGPLRLSLPIADILEIRLNQKTPGILKATLSFNCIIIVYGRYKKVFIAPARIGDLIRCLREINRDITVKQG